MKSARRISKSTVARLAALLCALPLADASSEPATHADEGKNLPVVKMEPKVRILPAIRQGHELNAQQMRLVRQFLRRHSLVVTPGDANDSWLEKINFLGKKKLPHIPLGYIVAQAEADRFYLGKGDLAVVHFSEPLTVGQVLIAYRDGVQTIDPATKKDMGIIVHNVGELRVEKNTPHGVLARITESWDSVQNGDLLAFPSNASRDFPLHEGVEEKIEGRVLYLQDNVEDAGSHQIVAVGVGFNDKAVPGLVMPVYRQGVVVEHPASGEETVLPTRRIGDAILFYVGEKSSFALLSRTVSTVRVGDTVRSLPPQ